LKKYLPDLPDSLVPVFLAVLAVVVGTALFSIVVARGRRKPSTKNLPDFESVQLLNTQEQLLFHKLKTLVPPNTHLLAQVSYGEFLKCSDFGKNNTMNQKRADFAVCDEEFKVLAAIEYQGSGHFGNSNTLTKSTKKRDDTKRASLAEAGIPLIEIPAKYDLNQLQKLLEPVFQWDAGIRPEPPLTSTAKSAFSDVPPIDSVPPIP
jgi:hypothetical protein